MMERSAALGLLAPMLLLSSMAASAAESPGASELEEIRVSARRREEGLLRLPVAVSVYGADALAAMGADTLLDLGASSPNVTFHTPSGDATGVSIFVRGVGQKDVLQTFEAGVGLYVDGVYQPRMQASALDLFDVERIEVLRGPQGTLYGKNAVGGAVNVITRDPFAVSGGRVEASFGAYDERSFGVHAGGPVMDDRLAVSFALGRTVRKGYFEDTATGVRYSGRDDWSARGKLAWRPADDLTLTFAADITDIDQTSPVGQPVGSVGIIDVVTGPAVLISGPAPHFEGKVRSSLGKGRGQTNTHWGLSLTADWTASDALSVRYQTAWREMDPVSWIDLDATERVIADVWATWQQQQFSHELQVRHKGSRADTVIGAFLMTEESVGVQSTILNDFLLAAGTPVGFERPGEDEQDVRSLALYAHSDIAVTDRFSVAAGLRLSRDDKTFHRVSDIYNGGALTSRYEFDESDDWSALTPSLSLTYSLSDTMTVYALASRGFRSGGFNGRLSSAADALAYNPEFLWNYEAGLKGEGMEGTFTWALAAFHSDYSDYQVRVAVFANTDNPAAGFNFPTINAASLGIDGLEAEAALTLGAVRLWGNVGLLDASFTDFTDAQGDRSGNVPMFAPDLTAAGGATWTLPLMGGSLALSADFNYRSSYYLTIDNTENLKDDGHVLVHAGARWSAGEGGFYLRAGVRNLTDALYRSDGFDLRTVGGIETAYYGAPRTWYVGAGYEF